MKLCLVSQEYPPETGGGGIGTQTYLKAQALAARGHEVHVISSTYTGADHTCQDGQVILHRIQNPACEAPFSELSVQWVGYSWAVAKKIHALLDETWFDLIEFPEYGAEGFIYQLDAPPYHQIPIVTMLHGSLAMFTERIGWPERESTLYRFGSFMEEAVINRADLLTAASRNIAGFWAHKLNKPLDEIVVFHTAVDANVFSPSPARKTERPTILFVGRIDGAKGVLAVAEAVVRLRGKYPDILFRLVGTGDEYNQGRLREVIEANQAHESFELVGYVPHDELAPYYADCDLFASPAAQEHGVASVYLEALSCGKPVVACNTGGAPEAVIDNQTGLLVPPDDVEALVQALDRLLASPDLRNQLGSNGRKLVVDYFSIDKHCARVEETYQRLIASSKESHQLGRKMKPFFVDEDDNIFVGDEAAEKLQARSDTQFLQEKQGVIEVDLTRWKTAQHYERRTWMEAGGLAAREDRNTEHEIHFDHYTAIAGRHFENALEIGCGPFTNMIRALKYIEVKQVTLLDPLINEYLTHPNCTYREHRLGGVATTTVASPVEDFSPHQKFDLVVMINVLEHCFSLPKLFERINALMAPGGILVFHDKLIPASEIDDFVRNIYDAGHPIRVADRVLLEFLSGNYEEMYRKHVEIPLEDYMSYTFDSIYFIGRKRDE